jgi:hypothetical protein
VIVAILPPPSPTPASRRCENVFDEGMGTPLGESSPSTARIQRHSRNLVGGMAFAAATAATSALVRTPPGQSLSTARSVAACWSTPMTLTSLEEGCMEGVRVR